MAADSMLASWIMSTGIQLGTQSYSVHSMHLQKHVFFKASSGFHVFGPIEEACRTRILWPSWFKVCTRRISPDFLLAHVSGMKWIHFSYGSSKARLYWTYWLKFRLYKESFHTLCYCVLNPPPRMWIGGLKRWLDVVSSKPSCWIMTKNMLNSVKSMLYFYLDNSVKTDFYWITTCPFYVRLYVDSLTLIQWFTLDIIWKLLISICVGLCNVGDTE